MPITKPNAPKAQYHPAVDAILVRHLGSDLTVADLTHVAAGHPAAILIELLHANACRVEWAAKRLESHVAMVVNDLTSTARDIPHGPRVEVATGTLRDIPALVATYHEALLSLEAVAKAAATFGTAPAAPLTSQAEASS
ncbi:hypothetical protein [Catenulispora pinisilvae]|uniref:hypothetical protein n=1 Tax=Catenulispora pinisilvae TaxID=2705253 RepID=UPI001890C45D|nr:hypothetical protein [Catenulispora pinisilvae]